MAKVLVIVNASAVIEVEEEFLDGYSEGDFLEAADNSALGWMLTRTERVPQ